MMMQINVEILTKQITILGHQILISTSMSVKVIFILCLKIWLFLISLSLSHFNLPMSFFLFEKVERQNCYTYHQLTEYHQRKHFWLLLYNHLSSIALLISSLIVVCTYHLVFLPVIFFFLHDYFVFINRIWWYCYAYNHCHNDRLAFSLFIFIRQNLSVRLLGAECK